MRALLSLAAMVCCLGLALTAPARDIAEATNLQVVRNLYEEVRKTRASEINASENTQTIVDRLQCYERNHDYGQRIQICNNAYIKRIIYLARMSIHSRPDLGKFVQHVGMCPIQYNLCMGQTQNDKERCILFERQCIDHTLDVFWRGSAQYTQQTYRLDQ